MSDGAWRGEADDEWLAERRSSFMGWLRRRFRVLGGRPVGAVQACRSCQADSWLLRSRMPSASRARAADRKNVI